jgi:ureidoacrylate peracid hydrolase
MGTSNRRILRTLEEKVRPEHTALLVVDVQNDFCHSEGAYVKRGNDVSLIQSMVPKLQKTIEAARERGLAIIFLRIVQSPDTNSDAWEALESDDEGPRLVMEDTWGADYFDPIRPRSGEREIVKHRHSGFNRTKLDLLLRSQGIKTVVLGGVASNVCVEATAREAADNDYYVVFLEDGSASAKQHLHDDALFTIRTYIGQVATCDEVIEAWQAAAATREPQTSLRD